MTDEWYQEATINGVEMPVLQHKESAGLRWREYLEPLIPPDRGRALDLGCNAGFYSRKLADLGFAVTAIDRDVDNALYWEKEHPKGIKIIQGDITKGMPGYSQVAIAACVFYWIAQHPLEGLVERLRHRVANVIVMSRIHSSKNHLSNGTLRHMEKVFRLWNKGKVIERGRHYSVVFHNPKIFTLPTRKLLRMSMRGNEFRNGFNEIINLVLDGKNFIPENTDYFKYLTKRAVGSRMAQYLDLIRDVQINGILVPVKVCNGKIIDGDHRVMLARALEIPHLLCEDTSIG